MEQYVKTLIKFYDDEKEVLLPSSYDEFNSKLLQMLGLTGDFLNCLNIYYLDEEKDNVEIKSKEDYQQFFEFAKKQEGKNQINIQIKEESNVDIKCCSNSILSFVEKNNIENINIVGENKNSALSKEISSEVNNKENKNKKSVEKLPEININNESQKEEKENEKKKMSNQINRDENIAINNINNDNHNINNNQINNNISNSQRNNIPYQENNQIIKFNAVCGFCKRYPLNQELYYCKECNKIFCSSCEKQVGKVHEHPYYKVQNQKQFDFLNFRNVPTMNKMIDDFGKAVGSAVDSFAEFFGMKNGNINNINNNNIGNNQQVSHPQRQFTLIEQARSRYELSNVSDEQIEEALKKSGNNIDEAVILLFSQ